MKLYAKLVIFIFLAIFALAGCRQPVGSIDATNGGGNGNGGNGGNGGGAGDLSFMWLVPNRLLYETEDRFVRDEDLQILVAEDGAVKEIPPASSSVLIEMIGNPGLSSEYISVVGSHFPFSMPGRYIVSVTYNGKSARYSIEVRGTFAGGGDGSDFFDIIWL